MFDYDNLKIAHKLAYEYAKLSDLSVQICLDFQPRRDPYMLALHFVNNDWHEISRDEKPIIESLTNLIQGLRELSESEKTKPKYQIGQSLWFIDCPLSKYGPGFEIIQKECKSIDFDSDSIRYVFIDDVCWEIKEQDVFISRLSLIESQINYWQNQLSEEIEQDIGCYARSK